MFTNTIHKLFYILKIKTEINIKLIIICLNTESDETYLDSG